MLRTILTIALTSTAAFSAEPGEPKITPSQADSPSYDSVKADTATHTEKRVTWKAIQFTHTESIDFTTGKSTHTFVFVAADAAGAFGDTTRAFAFSFTGKKDDRDTAASKALNLAQPEPNRTRLVSGEVVGAMEFKHPTGTALSIPELDDVTIDVLPGKETPAK